MKINLLQRFFDGRFWALVLKEIRQILKNRQSIFLLIFPPTIQLLVFGLALSPNVDHLSLGLVDYANSGQSREFVSALVENDIFQIAATPKNEAQLQQQVRNGQLIAGLIIPPDFDRDLNRGNSTFVQVFIDGVDANTAGITRGYLQQIINAYNRQQNPQFSTLPIETQSRFLYNPGLISSWFFVPGVIGVVLTLTGSLISSVTVIREKDVGTLEQLLMTPASGWEILLAKIVPLFVLLMGDVLIAAAMGKFIFNLPFRGNFLIFYGLSGLYVFVSIGLGILLATLSRTQQQVVLTSFFFNAPIIQLSGAIAPIESMPTFFQILSWFDPLRHYVAIARSLILKGVAIDSLWPNIFALCGFAIILLSVSVSRFRAQLN
ncbi:MULTISPECIES: ABC transporter permease [Cyanophyceae]|uniref:ABC transporter permease n=1 Tax=Cyanophyceae TaxID=3028117 RepID=UPI00016DCBD9|nr:MULTISPECIES: ABC transporter permease [Cyanophyceae]ACA99709.1 ABC-2 type transporter protein [Picosynechococcus sp. PCC 7002]SMH56634.1 ABC-2 type transport system permease protein [Picosynechococcus sp. OG1]SMQ83468.1 ABC-2 type transport system permease protein [Synechococcus sp. 7002]